MKTKTVTTTEIPRISSLFTGSRISSLSFFSVISNNAENLNRMNSVTYDLQLLPAVKVQALCTFASFSYQSILKNSQNIFGFWGAQRTAASCKVNESALLPYTKFT